MSPKESELGLRQQQLLIRSTALRLALADQSQVLARPLAVADRAVAAARWLYLQRGLLVVGALVVVLLRPRRALRWLGKGWSLWRTLRRISPWLLVAGEAYREGAVRLRRRGAAGQFT